MGTTQLGRLVGTYQEYMQSFNELTHEEEGNYFINCLNKMWVQDEPRRAIDIFEDEQ